MAINKQHEHTTGDVLNHHVINILKVSNKRGSFELVFDSYEDAARYNDGKQETTRKAYVLSIPDLPASVKQALGTLKNAIELEALNIPYFSGGTIVNDNGTQI